MKPIYKFKINFFNRFSNTFLFNNFGLALFQLGIILLAAAPTISISFLLISSIAGGFDRRDKFLSDKLALPLILSGSLMCLNALMLTFNKIFIYGQAGIHSKFAIYSQDLSLLWIGLLNWIPFFWCFWSFQKYLRNNKLRIQAARLFIIGTLPVLISGFCQYFFDMYGPYRFLNNLIIWYQRPIGSDKGVTGIFNNQNYAGAWLCILLPICIGFFLKERKNIIRKSSIFLLFLSFVYMTILTTSRSAIFSSLLSIFILFKFKKIKWFALTILITIFLIKLFPNFSNEIININNLLPGEINKMFSMNLNIDNFPRIELWTKTLYFIKSNLFFGYGSGSFPFIYSIAPGEHWGMQHTHNFIFQIAFNYGIICAFLIGFSMLSTLYLSGRNFFFIRENKQEKDIKYQKNSIIDKTWVLSFFIFFLIHMFDLTYFDGRISILSWILLAGMRSIITESKNKTIAIS